MAKASVHDTVAELPKSQREQMSQMALAGRSIVEIAKKYKLDYGVVRTVLWQQGTLSWQGSKTIITSRLRALRTAGRRDRRAELAKDIKEEVDYLYYAARQLQTQLDKVKKSIS